MAILNYTTKIDSTKTIGEITKCLVSHGAKKIVSDYDDDGIPTLITFLLPINDRMVAYALPANYSGVLKAMEKAKGVPRHLCTKEQAVRVSWRIVKDWIEAQMAIVEANLADMAEVFLPYAVTPSGNTLYHEVRSNPKLLGQ
ncbi:hypothetical protein [Parapedobacter indicus]|uniref:Uncharacterized protein n=1 Tax=Parapedobacter indicus TaxID=1477437 RepID=A0A1I3E3U9_9SPHI|nr:hypothetical protein [Parapedobacter indicus]PPL04957.1 hypothetical protein CLV26_101768 [Parapedobacter indicus]SFH93654.1 hypothetical protein SAMN05444682_101754 [Parapedobacter indicus]